MKEIIFAGFGGQGVLTGGLILAYMAANKDMNAVWMPAYGPTMRGGKANCVVKFGETLGETIGSPIMESADVLVAMNQPALDYLKFCKPNATVFVNSHSIPDDLEYPAGMEIVKIDCVTKAEEINNDKGQNLVMMAAAIKKCKLFDEDYAIELMCKFFADKGKGKYNDANILAVKAGYSCV